jgi:ATP-dependent helicase HrpB
VASLVERDWLAPTGSEVVHAFDATGGRVRATRVERYGELPLASRDVDPDPAIAAALVAKAWLQRGPSPGDARLLGRLRFAGHPLDLAEWARRAAEGATTLADVDLARHVPAAVRGDLDRLAPDAIVVPSGRSVRIDYHEDGSVSASVKLQELFGLADTPRVGPRGDALVLSLLAPNGRPVQTTRDLRSFWERTYPEVRKELRGRYPKHPWPEDPWTAVPTARTMPRKRNGHGTNTKRGRNGVGTNRNR